MKILERHTYLQSSFASKKKTNLFFENQKFSLDRHFKGRWHNVEKGKYIQAKACRDKTMDAKSYIQMDEILLFVAGK